MNGGDCIKKQNITHDTTISRFGVDTEKLDSYKNCDRIYKKYKYTLCKFDILNTFLKKTIITL